MFQLVVAVISVILIGVLSVAAFFFMGDAFVDNSDRTLYAKSMNGASQIEGALNLHLASYGTYPTGTSEQILQKLVDEDYLSAVPEGVWLVGDNQISRQITDQNQCKAINKVSGKDVDTEPCPKCDDVNFLDYPACENVATP